MADIILNLLIFLITAALIFSLFRKDGQWTPDNARGAFRFFTVQSNTLCAVVSLITAVTALAGGIPQWAWTLKYIGTAAVTVTMLTVIFFLAPSIGKDWYDVLLKGASNLFMHLLTPLMALVSFCLLEKRGMSFPQCLWGMLPVVLYGPLYLYKIAFAPEEKRWKDFYGFNANGNRGVAAGLGNIQKVKDGERLAGKATAASDFDEIEGDDEDVLGDDLPDYLK